MSSNGDRAKERSVPMPVRIIASSFALTAFVVAIVAGLWAGNTTLTTLMRAVGLLVLAWPVGWLLGWLGQRAVTEHIEQYKQAHPLEEDDGGQDESGPVEEQARADGENRAAEAAAGSKPGPTQAAGSAA